MRTPREMTAAIAQVFAQARAELHYLRLLRHLLIAHKLSVRLGLTTVAHTLRTILDQLSNAGTAATDGAQHEE